MATDGLLDLIFPRVRVFDDFAKNRKASSPPLKLNRPQKCLPIGIGDQRYKSLRRHRQPLRLFPRLFYIYTIMKYPLYPDHAFRTSARDPVTSWPVRWCLKECRIQAKRIDVPKQLRQRSTGMLCQVLLTGFGDKSQRGRYYSGRELTVNLLARAVLVQAGLLLKNGL